MPVLVSVTTLMLALAALGQRPPEVGDPADDVRAHNPQHAAEVGDAGAIPDFAQLPTTSEGFIAQLTGPSAPPRTLIVTRL